MYFNEINTLD